MSDRGLPQPRHPIDIERVLIGHQKQILQHGLGDQHSIERVSVRAGERAGGLAVSQADRQGGKALALLRRFTRPILRDRR